MELTDEQVGILRELEGLIDQELFKLGYTEDSVPKPRRRFGFNKCLNFCRNHLNVLATRVRMVGRFLRDLVRSQAVHVAPLKQLSLKLFELVKRVFGGVSVDPVLVDVLQTE
jgi:hypothetical protein